MKIFKLEQCGRERGDCTAPYKVKLYYNDITVEEFVHNILLDTSEWGYISIKGEDYFNPKACIEYSHGIIISEKNNLFPYYNRIIINASADGGWSRMDYVIEIEE